MTTTGRSRGFSIALSVLGLALHCAAVAAPKTLNGTVSYRERIALPPSAVVEVKLVEVSRADAPATTIAETSITPAGQVPVQYRLEFDDTEINPGRTYALQARVTSARDPYWT
jgi:putative lipoprotein